VAVALVTLAATPLNITVLLAAVVLKPVPVMVTEVPIAPVAGVKLVMVGGVPPPVVVTVKLEADVAAPPAVVIDIVPVEAAFSGTVTVIDVAVAAVTDTEAPFNVTVLLNVAAAKLVPVMVTDDPTTPLAGVKDLIVGAEVVVGGVLPPPVVDAGGKTVIPEARPSMLAAIWV